MHSTSLAHAQSIKWAAALAALTIVAATAQALDRILSDDALRQRMSVAARARASLPNL